MKAVIMNAGIGKRMGRLTKDKPKCLIEVYKGETILGRQLKILMNNGINDVIMTTGYFEDKIKHYIKTNFPDINIEYVFNPKYNSTNCIYSLFLTKDFIDDDVIFMTGDLVFEEKIFQKFLDSKEQNTVLVNNKVELPEKDFKCRIENGKVMEISVDIFGENCFFSLPIYKVSKKSFLLWLEEIGKFVKKGETNVYAENALNAISSKMNLKPIYFSDEFCMEVDNNDEFKIARKYFNKRGIKMV